MNHYASNKQLDLFHRSEPIALEIGSSLRTALINLMADLLAATLQEPHGASGSEVDHAG